MRMIDRRWMMRMVRMMRMMRMQSRSKRFNGKFLLAAIGILVFISLPHNLHADSPDADSILKEMERTLYPEQYYMKLTIVTQEPGSRERAMELEIWYRKDIGTYMELLAPARSRGTRFLNKDDSLWMYMPRSGGSTPIRLPARDSFQGSVFSNDDIGDSSYTDDYGVKILGEELLEHTELGTVDCWLIEMTALHPEAAYASIRAWVTKDGYIPLKMDYYVRSGLRSKQMFLYNIQTAAGRMRPLRMEMISTDEQGKTSVVEISELEKLDDIPDRIFTRGYLTR
jgi:outer membrane lipoprotein-sorting protein